MAFEYAIVLTGSIATGKSTVAKFFSLYGFTIIDADTISHTILEEQHEVIAEMFGSEFVRQGSVDRKALGKLVFSDKVKRQELERLLHPLIFNEIEQQAQEEDKLKKPYFVDIPLFFENGRYPIKKSLLVYADKKRQLERLMQRDAYSKQEAQDRIDTQMDIEEKRQYATYIVDNRGDLNDLKHECVRVKEKILGDFR